jgi:hypothetical protein
MEKLKKIQNSLSSEKRDERVKEVEDELGLTSKTVEPEMRALYKSVFKKIKGKKEKEEGKPVPPTPIIGQY